jgi:hypothetical protein
MGKFRNFWISPTPFAQPGFASDWLQEKANACVNIVNVSLEAIEVNRSRKVG